MRLLLGLARRNLLRNTRRTLLSTSAIVVGIFYLVVGKAFVGGIQEGMIRSAEDGLSAQLQLRPRGYPDEAFEHPVDRLLDVPAAARSVLEREAIATTPRLLFIATAIAGAESLRARGIGFDPARDAAVFHRDTWVVDGKIPMSVDDGVLLGRVVASLLRLEPGGTVTLKVKTHGGALNALELKVAGVVTTSNMAVDSTSFYLPMDAAVALVAADRPTHLAARFDDRDRAEAARATLAGTLGECCDAVTWVDETRDLMRLQRVRRRALDGLVGILLLMSSFGIANTILMAAHERVREIGTLRALGMSRRGVLALFLLEGGLMGGVSGIAGAVVGSATAFWFAEHPIDISSSMSVGNNVQFSTFLYAVYEPWMAVVPVVVSVVVALSASLYPARVASGMVPADAVRG